MKHFFKIAIIVIVVLIILILVQVLFSFRITDTFSKFFGGTELSSVHVNVGHEYIIPAFEIVSLEIFYPKNLSVIEVSAKEWWRLNIGTVFIFINYDSYVRLGVKNPELIKMERIDNTVYVDESTIVISVLDQKVNNFEHIKTFTSNIFVQTRDLEGPTLQAINELEKELSQRMNESNQIVNFDYAKRNFMDNYKNLCKAMGLEVVWR
ncbi:MAG: hypothetical protein FWD24_02830 [Treponema sp.]|nr:hypothetical protein [Treponema sp.]